MSALRLMRPIGRIVRSQPSEQSLLRNHNLNYQRVVCALISSKANMVGYQRPPPFPYKEKKYNWYYQLFDRTVDRFNENTKVLLVEGPIAAGKSTFAKQLAEDLDMEYFPEANFDTMYINAYGSDLRSLNPRLPRVAQYLDIKGFYRDPKHPNVPSMQMEMLFLRYNQYIDALAHLFNTGQGVVLDRSIYSDFVFLEAMNEAGFIPKNVRKYYYDAIEGMQIMLKAPHLVIYLDVPVSTVQQRIKQRNLDWEVNTSVLNAKYLNCIERLYKDQFLKDMSVKSEVLVYDWSNFGDVEVVVEDIERLDLEPDQYEVKFKDWRVNHDREFSYARWEYTMNRNLMLARADPDYLVPELVLSHYDAELREELEEELAGNQYEPGYNPSMGDKVLWKWK